MQPFRTHYDNLKVRVDAPPEIISAAYRVLSKRYHPDANPNDPKAERIMRIINASYEILSDPEKRREHDDWIAAKVLEFAAAQQDQANFEERVSKAPSRPAELAENSTKLPPSLLWVGLLLFVGLCSWVANQPPSPSGLPQYEAEPSADVANGVKEQVIFVRPSKAPNGSPWPASAGYVAGYPIARADGLSKLTIDNTSNSSDVFVKLVALDAERTMPIRHAFVPGGSSFTMNKIRAGSYDLRHMDLNDGSLVRSESFNLEEIEEAGGVRFSVTTMTLFKVANGNMQSYPLNANEF